MSVENPNEWRLDNASHLKGLRLQFRCYTPSGETSDHDHCSACWAKFAKFEGMGIQHQGYVICVNYERGAGYEWVCCGCFDDLKGDMEWTASPEQISLTPC